MARVPQRQRVAAYAVIIRDDRILLARLAPRISATPLWTLPGGGLDHGEDPRAAVVREVHEETGLDVVVQCRLHQVIHQYDHGQLHLTFFLCEPTDDRSPAPPFRWVDRAALGTLRFPEANQPIVAALLRNEL